MKHWMKWALTVRPGSGAHRPRMEHNNKDMTMSDNHQGRLSIHPYIGGSASNLVKSVLQNGGVSRANIPTLMLTLMGTAVTFPIRLLERLLYSRKVPDTRLQEDPIFIIGHWRSGTTHLHNVISEDRRLGYLSTLQAIFPTCSVILSRNRTFKKLVAGLLPDQRMMDNMKMGVDLPQEEEFSLSCLTTSSHHCNHFPRTILQSFDRYVLFDTDEAEKEQWKKTYREVVRKASFMAGGRRLVLKNPYNTARIETLLEMYPNAKFIHIHRNPYNIYVSALHDFVKEAEEMALQEFSTAQFSDLLHPVREADEEVLGNARSDPGGQPCGSVVRGFQHRATCAGGEDLSRAGPGARRADPKRDGRLSGVHQQLQEEPVHLQYTAGRRHQGQMGFRHPEDELHAPARHRGGRSPRLVVQHELLKPRVPTIRSVRPGELSSPAIPLAGHPTKRPTQ
ncbi:MAG: sulfotransferase [Lysobacter sp.]|nr:sulfotransferase [Lysobacter sp.]